MSEGRYFYKRDVGYLLEMSPSWGIGLALCHFDDHCSLHVMPVFGNIFIRLPKWFYREAPIGEISNSYGFTWRWGRDWGFGDSIHFNWGVKYKIINMPWQWTQVRHEILMADRSWRPVKNIHFDDPDNSGRPWEWEGKFIEKHPYTYLRKNGEVQNRTATIGVEVREIRWRWFKWLPFPRIIRKAIDVAFDDEVGEHTGSWKGGTIGCGYTMKPGETPLQTLRRMETERKF